MANGSRKCPYCDEWNRVEDGYFNQSKNRVFCNESHDKQYRQKGSLKTQERRAIKFLSAPKKKPKIALEDKSVAHHQKITRDVIQKAARMRDAFYNYPCITCDKHCKSYDGGHCKTAKAHPSIQFDLRNINRECPNDNQYNDNHVAEMRVNIKVRYGQERLDWIDSFHERNPNHSDKEYLARMRRVINKYMKRWEK